MALVGVMFLGLLQSYLEGAGIDEVIDTVLLPLPPEPGPVAPGKSIP